MNRTLLKEVVKRHSYREAVLKTNDQRKYLIKHSVKHNCKEIFKTLYSVDQITGTSPWFYGSRKTSWMVDIIYSELPLTHLRYLNPIATLNISFSLRLSRQMSISLQSKWSGRKKKKRESSEDPSPHHLLHPYLHSLSRYLPSFRYLCISEIYDVFVIWTEIYPAFPSPFASTEEGGVYAFMYES